MCVGTCLKRFSLGMVNQDPKHFSNNYQCVLSVRLVLTWDRVEITYRDRFMFMYIWCICISMCWQQARKQAVASQLAGLAGKSSLWFIISCHITADRENTWYTQAQPAAEPNHRGLLTSCSLAWIWIYTHLWLKHD